ncbi:hypothetical protein HDU97_009296 [Phlyctochytrium planicorne]|nr:hypothetical protein HDU97_009296 [Phlyctochytrium planicorne]
MERRILDSLEEEETATPQPPPSSANFLKPSGLGLAKLGRQPSAVHIGFSKPSSSSPTPTSPHPAPTEDDDEEGYAPPKRHASTLEAITPNSMALNEVVEMRLPSPQRRSSAIFLKDEEEHEKHEKLDAHHGGGSGGGGATAEHAESPSKGRRGSAVGSRRESLKASDALNPQGSGGTDAEQQQQPQPPQTPQPLHRRKSSLKAPSLMETQREEEPPPPPQTNMTRRKSSVGKPSSSESHRPSTSDAVVDAQPKPNGPIVRPPSSSLSSRAVTPLRRMRASSAPQDVISESMEPNIPPPSDQRPGTGSHARPPSIPENALQAPGTRARSPLRRHSLISGLGPTLEGIPSEQPQMTQPASSLPLAQIKDGVALELQQHHRQANDEIIIRRGITRTAFPNPEVLAHARLLARNPNADVRAMVAAYDPFPLTWAGPETILKDREEKGRPALDQWSYKGGPRFLDPAKETTLGPGTYSPAKACRHAPNAAHVVFKKGAPRFMSTSLSTATTANVAPGSYELTEIKIPKREHNLF